MKNVMLTICLVCFVGVSNVSGTMVGNGGEYFNAFGIEVNTDAYNYDGTCGGSLWARLTQGVGGRYYLFDTMNINFRSENDSDYFSFDGNAQFKIVSEITDGKTYLRESQNINMFGISYGTQIRIENVNSYIFDESTQDWKFIVSDDLSLDLGFSFTPGEVRDSNLRVSTWGYDDVSYLQLNFSVFGQFKGTPEQIEIAKSMFTSVPEPATILTMTLLSLAIRRKIRD